MDRQRGSAESPCDLVPNPRSLFPTASQPLAPRPSSPNPDPDPEPHVLMDAVLPVLLYPAARATHRKRAIAGERSGVPDGERVVRQPVLQANVQTGKGGACHQGA